MENNKKTLNNLQFLRFLASFVVIFAHVELYEFRSVNIAGSMFELGAIGVDLFFVISGFIMVHVSQDIQGSRLFSAGIFFLKRIARVLPIYAIFTLLMAAMAYAYFYHPIEHNYSIEQNYGDAKRDLSFLLRSLTFTNWETTPLYTVGWTLIYEFWFYVLFAVCIASRINFYAFFAAYAGAIVTSTFFGVTRNGPYHVLLSPLMLEFVMGVFLHGIYHRTRNFNSKAWFTFTLAMIAGLLLLCESDPYFKSIFTSTEYKRTIFWGGAAFCVVFIFLSLEGIFVPRRFFTFLGDASYSIYLTHWFCLTLIPLAFWHMGWFPHGSLAVYFFVSVAIALGISVLVHMYVERPLNRYFSEKIAALKARSENRLNFQTVPE